MSSEELQSKVSNGIDQLESTTTSALDEGAAKAKAASGQFSGKVEQVVGRAKETARSTAQQAKAHASRAADQASDTYEMLRGNAQRLGATIDPMVKEQPYMALVAGVVIGLLAGALLFGGGAKVIYIKPRT
jgi:ElaB/YqjD/DUF883 family membrane-anchored ribosome-binding protein